MTENELKKIEQRWANTTKGPWKSYIEGRDHDSGDNFIMTGISEGEDIRSKNRGEDIYLSGNTLEDQDFIANAKQDIPKLLNEIRFLKEKLN
jgi:hypothetical protein